MLAFVRNFIIRYKEAEASDATRLLQLTERRYPNLSAAERNLVEAATEGTDIYCAALLEKGSGSFAPSCSHGYV